VASVSCAVGLGLGAAACGSAPPASHATAANAAVAPSAAEPALALPAGVGAPRSTILIGDLHGTREIPAFVGRLTSTVLARQPVVLALEFTGDVAPSLDAYLASDGGQAARDAFMRTPWWQNEYQDGRRSVAMLELIDTARRLRGSGAKLTVACIDKNADGDDDGHKRDAAMADNVQALRAAHPDATLVVYAGNFHTRKTVQRRPGYETMAMVLAKRGLTTVSLNPHWPDGSAWVCPSASPNECGPQFMVGRAEDAGVHLERSSDGAYDGWFGTGTVTASPPAAFPALAAELDAQLAGLGSSPSARRAHATRAYNAKQYAQCAEDYASIAPPTRLDLYNQACCLALAGNKDAALDRLRAAVDLGYADAAGAEADSDLASLRGDPRWPFAKRP
jgi:hypothetical protein